MEIIANQNSCHDGDDSLHSTQVHSRGLPREFRVDLPAFHGDNVEDWLFRIEEYFDLASTPLEQRVKVPSLHMVGPAYSWYKWLVCNEYTNDWLAFANALQKCFGTTSFKNPQEALKELRQTRSVVEHQTEFEALSNKVHGLFEAWLISFFTASLEDHLKCQLRLAKSASYPEAVSLARLHEQYHNALRQSLHSTSSVPTSPWTKAKLSAPTPSLPLGSRPVPVSAATKEQSSNSGPMTSGSTTAGTNPVPSTSMVSKPSFKKFSAAELRDRRKQGLCYYCDEKYNPLHNCRAQCYALLRREDLDNLIGDVRAELGQEDDSAVIPEVSFKALLGEYNPSTLRLKGLCQGKSVNILVDNCSSFYFVKPTVAQTLGLVASDHH